MKIIRNPVQCSFCGDEIESTHVHDFKWCTCHTIAVDGGKEYLKRVGSIKDAFETSIVIED